MLFKFWWSDGCMKNGSLFSGLSFTLALLLLASLSFSSYLVYDNSTIFFGNSSSLAVFSCPSEGQCLNGFVNSSTPPLLTSARPIGDAWVEFIARRASGTPESCVLRLDAPANITSVPQAQAGMVAFRSGTFEFALAQTQNNADAFRILLNASRLCVIMPSNSTLINFYLIPQTNGSNAPLVVSQTSSSGGSADGASNASNSSIVSHASNVSNATSTPLVSNATSQNIVSDTPPASAPVPSAIPSFPNTVPAWAAPSSAPVRSPTIQPVSPTGRADAPASSHAPAPAAASHAAFGPRPAPLIPSGGLSLSFTPSMPYLALSALYALILLASARIIKAKGAYLTFTFLPLLVGLFLLPADGFKPVGLVAWVMLWLGLSFFSRRI